MIYHVHVGPSRQAPGQRLGPEIDPTAPVPPPHARHPRRNRLRATRPQVFGAGEHPVPARLGEAHASDRRRFLT